MISLTSIFEHALLDHLLLYYRYIHRVQSFIIVVMVWYKEYKNYATIYTADYE
jgi:hypothetical protein